MLRWQFPLGAEEGVQLIERSVTFCTNVLPPPPEKERLSAQVNREARLCDRNFEQKPSICPFRVEAMQFLRRR